MTFTGIVFTEYLHTFFRRTINDFI